MLDSRVESGLGIRSFDFRANRSHRSFLVSDLSDSLIFGEQPEQFAPIARQKRGNERESVRGGADLPLKPQAPPPPPPQYPDWPLSPHLQSIAMWGGGGVTNIWRAAQPLPLHPLMAIS